MHFIWHEMFKIASASGVPPQTPLGKLTALPRPPSREGLLAFGNCNFAPSALALSPIFSISVPPKVIYRFTPLPDNRPTLQSNRQYLLTIVNRNLQATSQLSSLA